MHDESMGGSRQERGKITMNKLDIIIGFVNSILSSGMIEPHNVDIKTIFDLVEEIESEAVDRGYISLKYCPKCQGEIVIVNLTTTGNKQYRASCKCRVESGENIRDLMKRWLLND